MASEENVLRVARAVTKYRIRRMLENRRDQRLADLKAKLSQTLAQIQELHHVELHSAAFRGSKHQDESVCHVHDFCDCGGDESVGDRVDAMGDVTFGDWSEGFMSGALALETTLGGMFTQHAI